MPFQGGSKTGTPWHYCDRCGKQRRVSDLVRQRGMLVCQSGDCVDNPVAWERPAMIQDALQAGSTEEMKPVGILSNPENIDDSQY